MYIPRIHIAKDPQRVVNFIKKYSFAILVSHKGHKDLSIVHIPIEAEIKDEELYLSGHVALENPVAKLISSGTRSTIIFSQPHAYVSSSWYDHVNVPTWNYIAVHCSGLFRKIEGEELLDSIKKMVEHYEDGRSARYNIFDMPQDMLQAHLDGLVGFDMKIDLIEAKYKLSQNRHDKDFKNIIIKLLQSSDPLEKDIANEMIQLRPHLNEEF